MEVLLDLYEEPYDPLLPVPCFDERPCQRVEEVREPLPMRPRDAVRRFDHEYRRGGIRYVHVAFEPLTGWRRAIITERRRKQEFTQEIRHLAEEIYPEAQRVRLVCHARLRSTRATRETVITYQTNLANYTAWANYTVSLIIVLAFSARFSLKLTL